MRLMVETCVSLKLINTRRHCAEKEALALRRSVEEGDDKNMTKKSLFQSNYFTVDRLFSELEIKNHS